MTGRPRLIELDENRSPRAGAISASRLAKLAVCVSAVALVALFGSFASVDDTLRRSFNVALESQGRSLGPSVGVRNVRFDVNDGGAVRHALSYAASEDDWLGHATHNNAEPVSWPVSWTSGLQVGDTVTLSGAQGARVLRVADISRLPSAAMKGDGPAPLPAVFIVTAREAGRKDGFVMRFLVESDGTIGAGGARSSIDRNL